MDELDKMEISPKQIIELRTDVKAILNILQDDKTFGRKGLVSEVAENKRRIEHEKDNRELLEKDFNKFKYKIIGYTAGAAAVATAVINIILQFF